MRFLLLAAVLLLSACSVLKPMLPPDAYDRDLAVALLAYNQRLSTLSAEEQRQTFMAAQQAFAGESSEENRLRLALAWCLPNASWRDDGRLFKLLEDSASLRADETSPMRQLALLLYQEVAERLQEQRRLEAALRDEKRRHEAQAREDKRRIEELQQKLDQLIAIERDFSRRQRPPTRPQY